MTDIYCSATGSRVTQPLLEEVEQDIYIMDFNMTLKGIHLTVFYMTKPIHKYL